MSIYVMAPVLRAHIPDAPPDDSGPGCAGATMKLVLLGLADAANEDGTGAHPGVRKLAEFAQCHSATVVRALHHLTAYGAITLADPGAPRRCATYDVNLDWLTAKLRADDRRTVPRAHHARKDERAHHARAARAPDARAARAPDARSSVPTSLRPAAGAAWPLCVTSGCATPVDPWTHRTRCPDHDGPTITTTTDPIPPGATWGDYG